MACILKIPTKSSKGVISLTNLEYFQQIKKNKENSNLITLLKNKWVFCYHPNWEDHNFYDDNTFECFIVNKNSFTVTNSESEKISGVASTRMSPNYFQTKHVEKYWDFVHVSRYQKSKNIEGFLRVVSNAIKNNSELRGVIILSAKRHEIDATRDLYNKYISRTERKNLEMITLSYDLPYPLSKRTIAFFYNHSKVSLNTHLNEPGGRVVGYAIASGLPVVGYKPLGEPFDFKQKKKPFMYLAEEGNEYLLCELLKNAVDYVDKKYDFSLHKEMSKKFSEKYQSQYLKEWLIKKFNLDDTGWNLYELDERLSTHFNGSESDKNGNKYYISDFLDYLKSNDIIDCVFDERCLTDNINKNRKFSNGKILNKVKNSVNVKILPFIKKNVYRLFKTIKFIA